MLAMVLLLRVLFSVRNARILEGNRGMRQLCWCCLWAGWIVRGDWRLGVCENATRKRSNSFQQRLFAVQNAVVVDVYVQDYLKSNELKKIYLKVDQK